MKNNFTKILSLVTVSIIWCLIGWILHGWFVRPIVTNQPADTDLVVKAREYILHDQYTTSTVTSEQLSNAAIHNMLAQTDDRYSVLFTPPASDVYAMDIRGEVGAPGLWFEIVDNKFVIVRIAPGKPAERAGLKVGDIILGVNNIHFDETTSGDEAAILLRGPIDTTAKITVQRNQEVLAFTVAREQLQIFTTQIISPEIGYLHQTLFPIDSETKMRQQLQTLLDQHVRALIWDLRESRGGSMLATQISVNYFIGQGLIYIAEFKDGQRQEFFANPETKLTDLPLVVLINEKTYSSSEMAAVALVEHQRAVLIGTATEGKGTIQNTIALDDNHLLRLTIARWLSPSGQWLQGHGVTPNIEMLDNPETVADEVLGFAVNYINQKFLAN